MLLAILRAVQDSGAWRIPLEKVLRKHEWQYQTVLKNLTMHDDEQLNAAGTDYVEYDEVFD